MRNHPYGTDNGGFRIKKAYRRRALELHPDRNYGNVERATVLFAEVQSAYEVLSDPQERAWYNSHETTILRGEEVGADEEQDYNLHDLGFTSADDITRMFRRFNGSVDFSDLPTGFYGFLRETFSTLAREEELAARREGTTVPEYLSFGHKDDTHEGGVKNFYAAWNGFATAKTFAWRDKYRQSDAVDRRMRRLIDKENKRLREEGIREFNDAVRALIAFVKKRDLRYKPNTQSEAERQQTLRDAAAAQAARSRAENAAKVNREVPEWTKAREPDDLEEETEEEIDEEHFECVACKKIFKSEQQFDAHERSKKHIKAVQALRRQVRKEGMKLGLEDEVSTSGVATPSGEENSEVLLDVREDNKHDEVEEQSQPRQHLDKGSGADLAEDMTSSVEELKISENSNPPEIITDSFEAHDDEQLGTDASGQEVDIPTRLKKENLSTANSSDEETGTIRPNFKLGKAAQKRAKRAAKQEADAQSDGGHKCASCNATFPSKTRLFQHIKDFGHAAPLPKSAKVAKGKKR